MSTTQHQHADLLAAIAQHLNRTTEAIASNQQARDPYTYTSEEGSFIRGTFHSNHGGEAAFGYSIIAYDHTTDISVEVHHSGIETCIMVPGDTSADVVAHAVMVALRTTIDVITDAQKGEVK